MVTKIKSTVSGFSTDTLLAFLLGDVSRAMKADILKAADESRELTAFINYLQRLLEANDFDTERVAAIAEQQTTTLVNVLKDLNHELAKKEEITGNDYNYTGVFDDFNTPFQGNDKGTAITYGHVDTPKMSRTPMTFKLTIEACTNRMPPTDPLSMTGVNDAKSPLHALTQAVCDELSKCPLDEKGLQNLLITWRNQLQNRSMTTMPEPHTLFQRLQSWLPIDTINRFKQVFNRGTSISGSPPPHTTIQRSAK
jgi:hypothetical protein